jgi:hypothetical protein
LAAPAAICGHWGLAPEPSAAGGLKGRPRPHQPILSAPRSFLIRALDFKGSLAQVAVPVAVEAGVVEA